MRRKVFDLLASAGGAVMVVVLVVAGALLMWGASFANNEVHNQLAKQEIFFPPKSAFEHAKPGTEITPSMIPTVSQYAGQQLLTGQQAEVYANDFIAVHLSEMPYHGVYAVISTKAREAAPGSPQAKELASLEQTSFQGTTLRGLLLEAYAFSVFGEIAFWAGIAAFVLAFVMAVLVGLGLWHARRTPDTEEILEPHRVLAQV
ncbi:hypothetical protein [Aciditerrimonas ferrireducens]|uniref:hypothetical protein n=1 Tax=Aciditerrimonas ferrireducens TaxID=667306 RepID=UPI0020067E72|nr:hypothetical protein [Aciditerrimonas ferrireducens]MCK4177159.1 hypothetical protein [Aciditerrimonas ferrireducens]